MRTTSIDIIYGGSWDEANNYERYEMKSMMFFQNTKFEDLQNKLKRKVRFNSKTQCILMEIVTLSKVKAYLDVKTDNDVAFLESFLFDSSTAFVSLVIDKKKIVSEAATVDPVVTPSIPLAPQPPVFDLGIYSNPEDFYIDEVPVGFQFITMVNVECPRESFFLNTDNAIYASKHVLKKAVQVQSLKQGFPIRVVKSDGGRFFACCKDLECSWFVKASPYEGTDWWSIKKFCLQHSCSVDIIKVDHPQATASIIADYIREYFRVCSGKFMSSNKIVNFMKKRHGIHICYSKAYRAREIILKEIRGCPVESYALVPKFCYVLTAHNPGSYVQYQLTAENRFQFLFMSLGASISGFAHCRPIVSVDGTFLKSKFAGVLLTACALDGNNQVFPIAAAVVDSENDCSWEWFFIHLNNIIGSRENLSVISDRHPSIYKAVCKVMPGVHYGVCMHHLSQNIKSRFHKKSLAEHFIRCAEAYTKDEHEFLFHQLELMEPRIVPYLNDIRKSVWSRAYFPVVRFNVMTTNICESYNAVLKNARELPIISALEEIRLTLEQWFYERRLLATNVHSTLTPWAECTLRSNIEYGRRMMVRHLNDFDSVVITFEMEYRVNIQNKKCECRRWNLLKIPCAHACAAIISRNLPPSEYVHKYYSIESLIATYSGMVMPIGTRRQWKIPYDVETVVVHPPDVRRSVGRPKMKRHISHLESYNSGSTSRNCSRCGGSGHNRKTCRNAFSYVAHN